MKKLATLLVLAFALGCGKEEAPISQATPVDKPPVQNAGPAPTPVNVAPAQPALQPIAIPADGKLENVKVCGVTVPMVNIMDGGATVLVDTDGVKPRSWEEQYKRKGDLPKGYFNLHKTNTNKNDKFDDDEVDKQGRWKMDEKGNIVQD